MLLRLYVVKIAYVLVLFSENTFTFLFNTFIKRPLQITKSFMKHKCIIGVAINENLLLKVLLSVVVSQLACFP